jgi:23S rRNA maturation mini-RNase III
MNKEEELKRKNFFYAAAILLALTLSYFLAFSKTINLVSQYRSLSAKKAQLSSSSSGLNSLSNELKDINANLERLIITANGQANIMGYLGDYCSEHNLTVTKVPQNIEIKGTDYNTITFIVQVQGSFNSITQLLYDLERQQRFSKLTSVHYKKEIDRKTEEIYLIANIYLQNLKTQ